jgi:hypothetical protein
MGVLIQEKGLDVWLLWIGGLVAGLVGGLWWLQLIMANVFGPSRW